MNGNGACNSAATEHEKGYRAGASPERVLNNGQDTANSPVTEIKEEPSTCDSPPAAFLDEQKASDCPATKILEGQSDGISPRAHTKEQTPGSKRGLKRKICVNPEPSMKRCSVNVTRLLADNDAASLETRPCGGVAVKRSRRTRKPTFSSSEWETPLDSPCRHRRNSETESTKVRTSVSSPSVRVSRPRKIQTDDGDGPKDSVLQDECGAATTGNVILPSELHREEVCSDSTSVAAMADCHEGDIKQDASISEDTTCGGGINVEVDPAIQTGGSTDTKQADDSEEMTPLDGSATSQTEDNLAATVAGTSMLIKINGHLVYIDIERGK